VRILPTYKIVSDLGMLDSYAGLTIAPHRVGNGNVPVPPVLPHDTGGVAEAASIDGAGPMRFFWVGRVPYEQDQRGRVFGIQFIYGWKSTCGR
jgi:sn-glycerol 3-phosphate transport system permease protein